LAHASLSQTASVLRIQPSPLLLLLLLQTLPVTLHHQLITPLSVKRAGQIHRNGKCGIGAGKHF